MIKSRRSEIMRNSITLAGNISFNFTKNTILAIDKALDHIKKHKKIYSRVVLYLALCMMPALIEYGQMLIYEFIYGLSTMPKERLLDAIFYFTQQMGLFLVSMLIIKDVVVNIWNSLVSIVKK